ncbi:unnamed protein product [Linum tenue]|uniref:Uncharacterized protein n=1 Tax=Linum tenue TaxID=586396 RepID=A0AAV0MU69_9ROSI|nr:unnamed protein product [Linum tenue]CAI0452063.1 unnamed protein product [Linum tenue]
MNFSCADEVSNAIRRCHESAYREIRSCSDTMMTLALEIGRGFRKLFKGLGVNTVGTPAREHCKKIQELVRLIMNGSGEILRNAERHTKTGFGCLENLIDSTMAFRQLAEGIDRLAAGDIVEYPKYSEFCQTTLHSATEIRSVLANVQRLQHLTSHGFELDLFSYFPELAPRRTMNELRDQIRRHFPSEPRLISRVMFEHQLKDIVDHQLGFPFEFHEDSERVRHLLWNAIENRLPVDFQSLDYIRVGADQLVNLLLL